MNKLKVDKDEYQKQADKTRDKVKEIDFGLEDLNNRQIATDNYLEKYEPIVLLDMMIEAISTIMDKKKVERLEEYKKAKHKSLLDKVTSDNGIP